MRFLPYLVLYSLGLGLVMCIPSPKKGLGLPSTLGYGDEQLTALQVSWFFSWSSKPKIDYTVDVEFVPMIFGAGSVDNEIGGRTATGKVVLGYNEPDLESQADVGVVDALAVWDQVVAKVEQYPDGIIGSPATAKNCTRPGNWLPEFMASNPTPRVDFMQVHWYKGPNAGKFIADMKNVIKTYGKPLWITEFAPQTKAQAKSDPYKYSQEEVNSFIKEVIEWMEEEEMVHRYAFHDARVGTSWLYKADGTLSESGLVYAETGSLPDPPTFSPTLPPATPPPTMPPTLAPTMSFSPTHHPTVSFHPTNTFSPTTLSSSPTRTPSWSLTMALTLSLTLLSSMILDP